MNLVCFVFAGYLGLLVDLKASEATLANSVIESGFLWKRFFTFQFEIVWFSLREVIAIRTNNDSSLLVLIIFYAQNFSDLK